MHIEYLMAVTASGESKWTEVWASGIKSSPSDHQVMQQPGSARGARHAKRTNMNFNK